MRLRCPQTICIIGTVDHHHVSSIVFERLHSEHYISEVYYIDNCDKLN